MSDKIDCPNEDCAGVLKDIPPQAVNLPTPESEEVYGGESPTYSTTISLPLVYCLECGQVFFKGNEDNQTPRQLQIQ